MLAFIPVMKSFLLVDSYFEYYDPAYFGFGPAVFFGSSYSGISLVFGAGSDPASSSEPAEDVGAFLRYRYSSLNFSSPSAI